jgi:hypothetical protein
VHSSAVLTRLAVAWTVPAGSGPGPANAGVTTTRSMPDSAVTAARSPAPATSDRERCRGRCRRRRPRTSAQPTPRDLQRTARAACLKHACLTAMAAWLLAFSGYRRGRPPAASTLRRGPGRVQVGRAQQRPTTRRAARAILLVPASLLLLTRYGLERGPPPLNPFTACSTAYRVQRSTKPQPRTRARWRRALVATARRATCNPGCCGGRFGGSASSSTHAHAHTLESTHTHAHT